MNLYYYEPDFELKCSCGSILYLLPDPDNPFFCPNCIDDLDEKEPDININNCPDFIEMFSSKPKCGYYGYFLEDGRTCEEESQCGCPRIRNRQGF